MQKLETATKPTKLATKPLADPFSQNPQTHPNQNTI
jgi:hypothetical protein